MDLIINEHNPRLGETGASGWPIHTALDDTLATRQSSSFLFLNDATHGTANHWLLAILSIHPLRYPQTSQWRESILEGKSPTFSARCEVKSVQPKVSIRVDGATELSLCSGQTATNLSSGITQTFAAAASDWLILVPNSPTRWPRRPESRPLAEPRIGCSYGSAATQTGLELGKVRWGCVWFVWSKLIRVDEVRLGYA